jgi:hypothetical protein
MNIKKIAKKITSEEVENRKQALADYLEIDINNITKSSYGDYYEAENKEYLIYNEDEAYDTAIESVKSVIDDCGIDCIIGYENYIDEDFFEEYQRSDNMEYCKNIMDENDSNYDNRLIKECIDANIIGDDDFYYDEESDEIDWSNCLVDDEKLIDEYTDYLCEQESPLQHMLNIYSAKELCKQFPNCIDIDSVAEYVVKTDGKGHCISSYDGKEIESNGYYIYRTN